LRWVLSVSLALAVAGLGMSGVASADRADGHQHRRPAAHVMGAPTHQAMYMQLLAEKFTPESAAAWKQTMAERVQLMNALRELKQSGRWKREDAKAKMEKLAAENGAVMQAHLALVQEFTKAVEAEDAKAIKAVLPKLLASEQKLNETLRKMIESETKAKSS